MAVSYLVMAQVVPAISIVGALCPLGLYDFIPIVGVSQVLASAGAILAKRNTPKK
jgi:hypothetical protein